MAKETKKDYSIWIGLWKTIKNSVFMLVPFLLAILVTVPAEYAWIAGPIVYMLKNWYETKSGKKLLDRN